MQINFIPDGVWHEPYTLVAIRDWMRSEVRRFGIVFLDELDKLEGETPSEWNKSLLTCLYKLLDGRLDSHPDWSEEDCRLLNTQLLCVGAGTLAAAAA